jgi:dihydroorotase
MSELLALEVPLIEVIAMATQHAAIMLGRENEIGSLAVGMPAELSAMRLIEGDFTLIDSERQTHPAKQVLHPEFALRGSKLYRANSPLLPALDMLAA